MHDGQGEENRLEGQGRYPIQPSETSERKRLEWMRWLAHQVAMNIGGTQTTTQPRSTLNLPIGTDLTIVMIPTARLPVNSITTV